MLRPRTLEEAYSVERNQLLLGKLNCSIMVSFTNLLFCLGVVIRTYFLGWRVSTFILEKKALEVEVGFPKRKKKKKIMTLFFSSFQYLVLLYLEPWLQSWDPGIINLHNYLPTLLLSISNQKLFFLTWTIKFHNLI